VTPIVFSFLCVVASVHDGDTFTCADSNLIVRMWGAASAELKDPAGVTQGDWMRQHILGQRLVCDVKGTNENRIVAQCYLLGTDIAADAVAAGAAADCVRFSGGLYAPLEGSQTVHIPMCTPKPRVRLKPAPATKPPPQ